MRKAVVRQPTTRSTMQLVPTTDASPKAASKQARQEAKARETIRKGNAQRKAVRQRAIAERAARKKRDAIAVKKKRDAIRKKWTTSYVISLLLYVYNL